MDGALNRSIDGSLQLLEDWSSAPKININRRKAPDHGYQLAVSQFYAQRLQRRTKERLQLTKHGPNTTRQFVQRKIKT